MEKKGGAGLDDELAVVLRRASWLGRGDGVPTVSFTSLWLGFLTGGDPFCLWVQETARDLGLDVEQMVADLVARSRAPEGAQARVLAEARGLAVEELPPPPKVFTPSATAMLNAAEDLVSSGLVGGRHVVAAYIYRASGHEADLDSWKLDQRSWASRFLEYVSDEYPDEARFWRELHMREHRIAPSTGVREIQKRAAAFAASSSPPQEAIDARLLLAGMLLDGEASPDSDHASTWLTRTMGNRTLDLLGLTQPPGPFPHTPRLGREAEQILTRAAAIASATTPEDQSIRARHLLGALLTRTLSDGAADLLKRAGVTPRQLRAGFLAWLSGWAPESELLGWRHYLERPADSLPLAGYDNDEAHGEDRLGMTREVQALAAVLASSEVKPPLSVGLFGDWGSGKSFFMELLCKRIEELAEASRHARTAGQPTSFCSEVIPITFNAWQYMDGNLWASLVTHIFDEINRRLTETKKPTMKDYAAQLASVKERSEELEREKSALAAQASALDASIEEHRRQREARKLSFGDAVSIIVKGQDQAAREQLEHAARELGLDRAEMTVEAARVEKQRLQFLSGRVAVWARTIVASPARAALAIFFLLLPVGLAAAGSLIHDLARVIGAATGALSTLVALVSSVRARAAGAIDIIDRALDRANQVEAKLRSELSEVEQRLRQQRAELAPVEAKLEGERLALAEKQASIEAELQALKDGRSFKKFVLERAASDDYRKQLGLIASVHRDFKALSERLRDSGEEPHVDRIVLFIDDLDRCPPDRVVEVLQAVHLILSFRLFVIVVAVDSRWLLRSLEAYYARQFQSVDGSWESKPQHYLEKIFQIPFALPPMTDTGFSDLVKGLLGGQVPVKPARARAARGSDSSALSETQAATPPARAQASPIEQSEGPPASRPALGRPLDLAPRNLEIDQAELDYLQTLAPLVRSPRAAKRLVNLYRIVRATLDDDELETFVAGRFKVTQLFLAAVVGYPSLAAPLFEAIFSGKLDSAGAVGGFLDQQSHDSRWADFARLLKGRAELADWEGVRGAARAAARYSFETGRVLRPTDGDGKSRTIKPPRAPKGPGKRAPAEA